MQIIKSNTIFIGKGGSKIADLQDETGASIKVLNLLCNCINDISKSYLELTSIFLFVQVVKTAHYTCSKSIKLKNNYVNHYVY